MAWTRLVAAALLCASCRDAGVEGSPSLVGAERLPPASVLSRELIQINRGYGAVGEKFLSYELRPDDSLTVTLTDRRRDRVLGEQSFRLASDAAGRVRRLLSQVRPARLQGLDAHEARPVGCERRGPHDFGELAIVFVDTGSGPGIEDDRIGIFELPDPRTCSTAQAVEARALVRQVLAAIPSSSVAADFER